MDQLSCIFNRRSVRKYTDEPVSAEHEKLLLRAGVCAPSAHNSRPWEFIVVRDKEVLSRLSSLRQYWFPLKDAGLGIVVCANLTDYHGSTKEFFVQDCAAATQNILNAAEGLGLGGVWLGCYPTEGAQSVARELHIPEGVIPFSVLSIGHPAHHARPHEEDEPQRIHYDQY